MEFSCDSCLELAILRLQTCFKHRGLHSKWEFSFFDSQGVYDAPELNSGGPGNRWSSLTLASANNLREELERVSKVTARRPAADHSAHATFSSTPAGGQYGRVHRILKALREVQDGWQHTSNKNATRLQQSIVLFSCRLFDEVPALDLVSLLYFGIAAVLIAFV